MLHSDYSSAPHRGLRLSEDRVAGTMIKSRRCMRVYSREQGPFVPQGSGLSGPSTMTFSVQANPDELLDFSTLRLRFDYIALFNGKLGSFFHSGLNLNPASVVQSLTQFPFGVNQGDSNKDTDTAYLQLPYLTWLDDGASSLLAAARVRLNGQLIEDISRFNILDHFLIYFTASRDWLFTNGMMAGYYLDYMVEGGGLTQTVPGTLFNNAFFLRQGSGPNGDFALADMPFPIKQATLGSTFTIPLCGLGIGRSTKYWPVLGTVLTLEFDLETWERSHAMTQYWSSIQNFGNLNMQNPNDNANYLSFIPGNFYTPTLTDAPCPLQTGFESIPVDNALNKGGLYMCPSLITKLNPYQSSITGGAPGIIGGYNQGGYQLSNAQIWVDALQADSSLTASMQKLLSRDGVGYSIPFETFEVVRYDMSQVGISPGNTLDLRGQITCQDLTSITAIFKNQSTSNDYTVPYKTNTFEFPYIRWTNWIVGGQQYPAFQTGLTVVSGAASPLNANTFAITQLGTAFTNNEGACPGPMEPALLMNSGSTEWFSLTRESLGLGSVNNPRACGYGIVNPYTFIGRTGISLIANIIDISAWTPYAAFQPGSVYTNANTGHAPPLTNALPPRFALGQSLEIAQGSKTGIDTMNSSNEFVLRVGIDNNPNLSTILAYQVFEVLFLCRYNAAIVFANGTMSVRR